jgi:hypothetical protein
VCALRQGAPFQPLVADLDFIRNKLAWGDTFTDARAGERARLRAYAETS